MCNACGKDFVLHRISWSIRKYTREKAFKVRSVWEGILSQLRPDPPPAGPHPRGPFGVQEVWEGLQPELIAHPAPEDSHREAAVRVQRCGRPSSGLQPHPALPGPHRGEAVSARTVAGLPPPLQTSLSTRGSTPGAAPSSAGVARPSSGAQSSSSTSASTPRRAAIRLQRGVGRFSQAVQLHATPEDPTPGRRKLYEPQSVGRTFFLSSTLFDTRRSTPGRGLIRVQECGKAFLKKAHLTEHQKMSLWGQAFECKDCGKPLFRAQSYSCTRLFTLERNPMCAVIVGRHSEVKLPSAPEDPH